MSQPTIKQSNNQTIILGIDPGTVVMGYGVIQPVGTDIKLISLGSIHLTKYDDHFDRLHRIYDEMTQLINDYKPTSFAIEAPFFGKNVQSMLKLGRAQGVAIAVALSHHIPVVEYSPRKVKQSITGSGKATKEQVAAMLQQILKFEQMPKHLDATDGLAVALCHHFQTANKIVTNGKNYSSWEMFVKGNPKRVK